ncbi:Na+-driven multidrug efflux pump [Cryobacterium psychrotolerans]|uniref:Na+-driven multidrug efflux pump n=2 Tax=Microbacteriaceae TaxID=85023 RepID=A0A1G9BUX9_9MICO|nr:Na+-driven multidrug efflux pump [Cryobacterium psychrotolerans]
MIVTSITAMAMFADLGLGNGLLTRLAAAAATRDFAKAKSLISTAYVALGGIALLLLAIIWLVLPALDWTHFTRASNDLDPGAIELVAGLCLSAFAITIPLSLVQRVQYAFQEAWKSNVWQVAGSALTVLTVYAAAFLGLGYGAIIAAAVFSSPAVILINNVIYYALEHRELTPTFRDASSGTVASLLRVGLAFFFLSILTSLSLNVDNLILANVSDLETVSEFSVTTKLFSLLALAITLVALPLWPANGDALARGDTDWVRRATKTMMLLSVGAVGIGGVILVFGRDFITSLWLGNGHTISLTLAVSLVLWSIVMAFASPYFSVQNSAGLLRYQFVGWTLFALLSVPLKFMSYSLFGLPGIPLAGVVAYVTFIVPAALLGYRATMRRAATSGRA